MLNFTGTTKRRTVNLGDHRGNGPSFLEASKKERREREHKRLQERNATTIQRAIKRRLSLLETAIVLLEKWNSNPSIPALSFIARYGPRDRLNELLPQLQHEIQSTLLSPYQIALVSKSLHTLNNRGIDPQIIFQCYELLLSTNEVPTEYSLCYPQVLQDLICAMNDSNAASAFHLILKVARVVTPVNFIESLTNIPLKYFEPSALASKQVNEAIVKCNLASLPTLKSPPVQVSLLVRLIKLSEQFTPIDMEAHSQIINGLTYHVVRDLPDPDDESEGPESTVQVSENEYIILSRLVSASYVTRAFQMLQNTQSPLISDLMLYFPGARVKLSMMIATEPGLFEWLQSHLSQHELFKVIVQINDQLTAQTLPKLSVFTAPENARFWSFVYTFEHVLSSWLIVHNYSDKLGQNNNLDHKKLCLFLKVVCLALILRSQNSSNLLDLKAMTTTVLVQLYTKTSKAKIVEPEFWVQDIVDFDVEALVPRIMESDSHYDSDDERKPLQQTTESAVRLEILRTVPFFVRFLLRVQIFQALLKETEALLEPGTFSFFTGMSSQRLTAEIRRDHILQDGFEQFSKTGSDFRKKLAITFLSEHGAEAGIDGGGLTKEFLTLAVEEGLTSELDLFKETQHNEVYPNDDIYLRMAKKIDLPLQRKRLQYLLFMGMVIGKCLYSGVLLDVNFAPFFLSKWRTAQTQRISIDDLASLDEDVYLNLNKLTKLTEDELAALDINFVVNENVDHQILSFELHHNGGNEAVSATNRLSYIYELTNFKLNVSLKMQTQWFLQGFYEMIRPSWLNMFDSHEIQMLLGGVRDIDIADWKQNVVYGGYYADDVTILHFWDVVEEMAPQERFELIRFVTSVLKAPLLGFKALTPHFGISRSSSPDRLPTASTCVNLLKLPDYRDKHTMREKLLYAIHANSGFDLS